MRTFSSYGPIDAELHYHVPRAELIRQGERLLVGDSLEKGGHYITVWGPRQRGKTWVMQNILWRLRQDVRFEVVKLNLEHLKMASSTAVVVETIAADLIRRLNLAATSVNTFEQIYTLFTPQTLDKPLILMLDEFDSLPTAAINGLVGVFRNIYITRRDEADRPLAERSYRLHSVALIGVRSVLGVENVSGSPFNVQRSLHIPNLTSDEVAAMFGDYTQETGQAVESAVVEHLFTEVAGQPGLVSWFGELLTETYNRQAESITMADFEAVREAAIRRLPNSNILNIISKVKQPAYQAFILELFQTTEKIDFTYDNQIINFLYLNGVIDVETMSPAEQYVRFSCPFVQKRLFNYFADSLFKFGGQLHEPFADLADTVTDDRLELRRLLQRYEDYFQRNRAWLLRDVPRRATDLRVFEAVYHFNLYMYLSRFLEPYRSKVYPEFPTGNGQIDLLIRHGQRRYGLELKSFTTQREYNAALKQATRYAHRLNLTAVWLVMFVEQVDEQNRQKYEAIYVDEEYGVKVNPIFIQTGTM